MAVGRKIEDENEALRCLRAAKRRGVSAGEWARAHGIDARSLHAWHLNIGRRGAPVGPRQERPNRSLAAHALVELVPTTTPAAQGAGRYVLVVGDARVEFGDDASVATLRRVLEALRSC